jgi:6-phosphogluconolactonase
MEIYTPKLQHHEDLTIMNNTLLNNFLEIAEDSIYSTGLCRIALAGGNTPKPLYKRIGNLTLDWNSIEFLQTDERFVSDQSEDSNQKMILECLNEGFEKGARFEKIFIKETLDKTVESYKSILEMLDSPIFDLVLLGVGEDGHIASLFPSNDYLKGDQGLALKTKGPKDTDRISLSLDAILSAKNIIVYMTGENKANVIEEIFYGSKKAVEYPVKFLFAHPSVTIYYCNETE